MKWAGVNQRGIQFYVDNYVSDGLEDSSIPPSLPSYMAPLRIYHIHTFYDRLLPSVSSFLCSSCSHVAIPLCYIVFTICCVYLYTCFSFHVICIFVFISIFPYLCLCIREGLGDDNLWCTELP